ncbi:hypothetical protein O3P69_012535 [Scylla paramamosain]|uniref:Uncharacterized protein n=1 Tax=Scylla paramamosain TaxID=85552 RepID=A0AAW0SBJ1_SCYPA
MFGRVRESQDCVEAAESRQCLSYTNAAAAITTATTATTKNSSWMSKQGMLRWSDGDRKRRHWETALGDPPLAGVVHAWRRVKGKPRA